MLVLPCVCGVALPLTCVMKSVCEDNAITEFGLRFGFFLSRTHTVIDCSLKHHQDCLVRLPEADSMRLGVVGRAVTCYE